jgi:hypothetical protein
MRAERKLTCIALIRIDLRSLAIADSIVLSHLK